MIKMFHLIIFYFNESQLIMNNRDKLTLQWPKEYLFIGKEHFLEQEDQ